MTVDGEDINIQNLCMFVKGLKGENVMPKLIVTHEL